MSARFTLAGQKMLVVEGETDKQFIEAFLSAGENAGRWSNWRRKLTVNSQGGITQVLRALDQNVHVWGLIDRDWQTETEIADLRARYPHLLVLPRVMIDNYLINPAEFLSYLPPSRRGDSHQISIDLQGRLQMWLKHGAISAILHENGAEKFCDNRGQSGYPSALTNQLETDRRKISRQLEAWHDQLDPHTIMTSYDQRVQEFQARPEHEKWRYCVDGKLFFTQEIVAPILNRLSDKPLARESWIELMTSEIKLSTHCPDDLASILQQVVT